MIGNIFTTFNRYTTICLMRSYGKIWTRRNVWVAIVVQYTVSFMLYIHTIRTKIVYNRNADGKLIYAGLEKPLDEVCSLRISTHVPPFIPHSPS
ncbi:hypothetical protein COOONC_25589 [Cooperia oncophora]